MYSFQFIFINTIKSLQKWHHVKKLCIIFVDFFYFYLECIPFNISSSLQWSLEKWQHIRNCQPYHLFQVAYIKRQINICIKKSNSNDNDINKVKRKTHLSEWMIMLMASKRTAFLAFECCTCKDNYNISLILSHVKEIQYKCTLQMYLACSITPFFVKIMLIYVYTTWKFPCHRSRFWLL